MPSRWCEPRISCPLATVAPTVRLQDAGPQVQNVDFSSCVTSKRTTRNSVMSTSHTGQWHAKVLAFLPPDCKIMAGRNQNRSVSLPGIQASGQLHTFGNCTDNDVLEEDAEVYELRSRGKEKVRRSTSRDRLDDIILLTRDIQEGDTLNAVALQYCCTVSLHLIYPRIIEPRINCLLVQPDLE